MPTNTRARQPRGIPTGGEFASTSRDESEVGIDKVDGFYSDLERIIHSLGCDVQVSYHERGNRFPKAIRCLDDNGETSRDPSIGPAVYCFHDEPGFLVSEERYIVNGEWLIDEERPSKVEYNSLGVKVSETRYLPDDGTREHKRVDTFHTDGSIQSVVYMDRFNDMMRSSGPCKTTFWQNGQKKEECYPSNVSVDNGVPVNYLTTWGSDGRVTSEYRYDADRRVDVSKDYLSDGGIFETETDRLTNTVRLHRVIRANGNLAAENFFNSRGVLESETGPAKIVYGENNEVIEEEYYVDGDRVSKDDWSAWIKSGRTGVYTSDGLW